MFVSIQDTKERIFVNGQIYSRPIGGGPVHGPDNRRFTPDPNPYDVPPEPRGYGQGTVDDFLYRPGVDEFEIRKPVLRPDDTLKFYRLIPLWRCRTPLRPTQELDRREMYFNPPRDQFINDVMDSLINRSITEQNQEVMGFERAGIPSLRQPRGRYFE